MKQLYPVTAIADMWGNYADKLEAPEEVALTDAAKQTEALERVRQLAHLRTPHSEAQRTVVECRVPRKIIRAGRRFGKTVGDGIEAGEELLAGHRVLYAAPTTDQVEAFWSEVSRAFSEPIAAGLLKKNETDHTIELPGTEVRIRAKTAWNADTLRGDYADVLMLDEWQLMDENAWGEVGAPMLLDNNGRAVFIYTPPSLHSRSTTKARDPRHASKMFKRAQADTSGRWAAFSFSSHDNPTISTEALQDITQDMTRLAYRQEIMAEDVSEAPGALWTQDLISASRVEQCPHLVRVVVGVDPPGGQTECGIVAAGLDANGHGYIITDASLKASPDVWAGVVLETARRTDADCIVGEQNYGGDMVESTVLLAAASRGMIVRYKPVHASRGKAVRAEPVVAMFEQGRVHLVGEFPLLEEEMLTWDPAQGGRSPNRVDACTWACFELFLEPEEESQIVVYDEPVVISRY